MNHRKKRLMNMRIQAKLNHPQLRSYWRSEQYNVALRFSPTAWAKLLYFRDKSDNEVGGFGISDPEDLLFVKEFVAVKQEGT